MKCIVCKTELVCKYYKPRGYGYSNAKERAVYECPDCGHKERFG